MMSYEKEGTVMSFIYVKNDLAEFVNLEKLAVKLFDNIDDIPEYPDSLVLVPYKSSSLNDTSATSHKFIAVILDYFDSIHDVLLKGFDDFVYGINIEAEIEELVDTYFQK